ncbi:glycosyltransferase [Lacipirellula parvula]|uniref:Glycosyltransferase 2-like domain-containing protein n=1 Tax=Lacipirellula parvula TaxID=2650471 RepID=A0A5K7XD80_9BACT|nr:glycosyltransferase [Lacipirellula parvula]BBO34428.1 hypothetical protein PLANPX_4040 [Lacipirellula parvula]
MSARPLISLCMIVRDNARTLGACLESIAPWVDEMIVVDTGSTDDTRQIAQLAGAQVHQFPWCDDFSAARNESLRLATGEWLFWMDSDDTISEECGRQLQELAIAPLDFAPTAFVMQVHCPGPPETSDVTVVDHVKMFRNDPRIRFEGRIHEQIVPAVRRINGEIHWTSIFVTHSGSEHTADARKRKQTRDLRLLELEYSEQPQHPFVLFNLGMTYADMDDFPRAVRYLEECLTVSAAEESHVRKAYALLAGCLQQVDRDEDCRALLERGLQLYDKDAELLFRLGVLEQKLSNHLAAVSAYTTALEDHGERRFSSRDRGITGYKARHNLAGVYREMGRFDLAELQWRLAIHDEPAFKPSWQSLIDLLAEQKKLVTLELELEKAVEQQCYATGEIAVGRAKLLAARGEYGEAINALDEAIACSSGNSSEAMRLKCQLLFEHFSAEDAAVWLERLCEIIPEDGAAWHNLATAHQMTGHTSLAAIHYERSLALRPDAARTWMQLGYAQRDLGRIEAAHQSWRRAKEIAPRDPFVCALDEALAFSGEH